jgi:hypothetical protein
MDQVPVFHAEEALAERSPCFIGETDGPGPLVSSVKQMDQVPVFHAEEALAELTPGFPGLGR